ncbi:MAG: HD domain-containing protein [Humidesulfovibrio sp.]|uniref:HD-GYP domain-containing protein n=1 Tax=Humidesulfovibrio sp. TaxID=2910988 RepID=UPI0027EC2A91|nr:HD domain-containing phosphohydrolase [Humidesulfovibrio sp.]MDQ7835795.1 HD domain-containing protein [Humidesulfovibrio sp.]
MTSHDRAHKGLTASLHRLLLRRIAGMTVLICLLVAGAVYLRDSSRFDDIIIEHTLQSGEDFRRHILAHLDKPDRLESRSIQAELDAIPPPRHQDPLGRTVYVRIMDTDLKPLAERFVPDYAHEDEVRRFMDAHRFPFAPGTQNRFRDIVRIAGRPHLHLGLAFTNSAGKNAAYVESLFAVSDKVLDDIAAGMLRSVVLAVLVVLATTLLLYPVIIRLLRRVTDLSVHLQESNLETLSVLGSAIAKRDSDTDQHNYRVAIYSVRLAEALGLDGAAIRPLLKGAMLHDVGKIGIRDAILLKPGPLTAAEFTEMQQHVQHGRDIVAQARWLSDAVDVISGHHERFDGKGYDQALANGQVPLGARLFAIADVFDALTSRRPYKEPLDFTEAMRQLEAGRGTHFDPALLDAFTGIARGLFDSTAASNGAELKASLQEIFTTYFTRDIEVMMEGMASLVARKWRSPKGQGQD